MASQIPIKVMKDGSDNTCGLAQFTSSDSVAIAAGGTGLNSQGICEFVQPGLYAVGCQVTYLGICAGKADTGVGYDNTYVGHSAGIAVTTACRHTIIGSQAGKAITTCSGTVAIGYNAGLAQTFGDFNTLIGTAGGAAITTASNNTVIGYHAATATICSNNIAVGTCAMVANTQGQDNIAIGVKAGATQVAAGCNNVFIGSNAGAVSLCRDNISIGSYAGKAATTGGGNVMIGACVGYGVVGGAYNVYVGDKAGLANTSGNDNVFIGKCAGCATTGSCCLIIGNATGTLIAGDFNSGVVEINSAYCLPAADGSASQFLCTDGSGALAFATLVSSPWSTSGCFITSPANCFVGIGTTTPTMLLHLQGTGVATASLQIESTAANSYPYLRFKNDAVTWDVYGAHGGAGDAFQISGSAGGSFTFTGAGALGIGTSAPIDRLHIVGDDGQSGRTSHEANAQVIIDNDGDAALVFSQCNTDVGVIQWDDVDSVSRGTLCYSHATDAMAFNTAGAQRMALMCDGLVFFSGSGISVGEQAVNWPQGGALDFLQVGGTLSFGSQPGVAASQAGYMLQNAYYDSGWKYQATDETSRVWLSSGNVGFDSATSGTAGTAITFATNMCIAVNGSVIIPGSLSKGSGSFRIRHPLESRDGYDLVHSFTESPQADLLYSGWTQLTSGATTINIDTTHDMTEGTFVALNRCIRVLTSNESGWDMVRGSVTGNQLTIESNNSSSVACVSWLVIGERCDEHMMETDWTDDDGRVIAEPKTEVIEEPVL